MARRADIHLQLRPGTNVAVLNGLMHVILEEGLADEDFIAERTEGFDELPELLAAYTPELVEEITGVPAEDLREAARLFGTAERAAIFYSMGITQHSHGTDNVLAVANLAMMTGNLGRPGTGVNPLRGQNNVQGACDMGALPERLHRLPDGGRPRGAAPLRRGLGRHTRRAARPHRDRGLRRDGRGSRAAPSTSWARTPCSPTPTRRTSRRRCSGLDFLVVQDIFLSETAALADVVLPAASFAEKDGTFTNTERKVQLLHKAVAAPGEAREDWRVIADLARRMGAETGWSYESTDDIMREVAALTPSYAGISHARLEEGGLCWPCPSPEHPGTPILHIGAFTRGRGRFFPVAYEPPAEEADEDYPLTLTTGRLLEHYHTGTMTRRSDGLNELVPTGFVEINPADAARLGAEDGGDVVVETRRGTIRTPANVTARVGEGTVFVPFHFWEAPANRLTNPARDPQAKIPEFKVCACRVAVP